MRERSIDVGRGLLVLLMVYCHVLQFFADTQLFALASRLIDAVNLLAFPSFVFFFGRTVALAYLKKPYLKALPGMLRTFARTLCAFYLSGIGYRVLRENKAFSAGTVRRVLTLSDIPGWSEFLISFALFMLLTAVLFGGLRALARRPLLALAAGAACVACCLIPYERVTSTQAALLIGGTQFSFFPVVQYAPYFLAGIVFTGASRAVRMALLALSAAASAAGAAYAAMLGGLPSRFPPHWAWILLPALGTAALCALSYGLCALRAPALSRALEVLRGALSGVGGRSLYYLVSSNLVLFAMAGRGIVPQLSRKSVLPFTLPIQSPLGALCWTAVLLLALSFVASLAGRGAKRGQGGTHGPSDAK